MPIRLGPSLPAPLIHIRFHPLFPVVQWAKSYQGHLTFLGRVPFQDKFLLSLSAVDCFCGGRSPELKER